MYLNKSKLFLKNILFLEMENFEEDVAGNVEDFLSPEPVAHPDLNLDTSTWEGWINTIVLYAAQNPWEFLYYVLLCLSPFFLMSIILSLKLSKALEAQEKENKRKAKREANISKARRTKAD